MSSIPRPVWFLGWTSLFTDAATEMIYPLLPIYLSRVLGAGATSLGVIEGIAEAINSVLKVVSGRMADRRSRRPIVIVGYAISSIARPFIAITMSWPQVLAIRALDRTGKGIRGAPRDAMLAHFAGASQRGRVFGFHRAMDHTGAIVGPLVATLFLFFLPGEYRLLFAFTAIPGAIAVAMLFLVREGHDVTKTTGHEGHEDHEGKLRSHDGTRATGHDGTKTTGHEGHEDQEDHERKPQSHDGTRATGHDVTKTTGHEGHEDHEGQLQSHDGTRATGHDGTKTTGHEGHEDHEGKLQSHDGTRATGHDVTKTTGHEGHEDHEGELRRHDGTKATGHEATTTTGVARPESQARVPSPGLPARLYAVLGVIFVFSLGNSADAFLLLRLTDALGSPALIPMLWAALHLVKASLSTWGGALSDRVGRKQVIVAGWGIYALVYIGFATATGGPAFIAWFLFYGVYFALAEGTEKALVSDLTPAGLQGTAFGYYNAALGVGALVASVMFGFLYDNYGASVAFGVGAGLAGLAAAMLLGVQADQEGSHGSMN